MQASRHTVGHKAMIGGMEFDYAGIEPGRISVGEACLFDQLRPAPVPSEGRERLRFCTGAIGGNRLLQRPVDGEKIDIAERRRLIEVFWWIELGRAGHGDSPRFLNVITDCRASVHSLPLQGGGA